VNDTLTIDFSDGDPFPSSVSFTGGSGTNSLIVAGINTTPVQVNGSAVTFGTTVISYAATKFITVDAGAGNDTLIQTGEPSAQLVFNAGSGKDTLQIDAGSYTLGGNPTANASLTVDDDSALVFAAAEPNMGINARNLAALMRRRWWMLRCLRRIVRCSCWGRCRSIQLGNSIWPTTT